MKNSFRNFLLGACAIFMASCSSIVPGTHGIPHFAEVEPGVYRGGQPGPEGWAYLKSLGVTYDLKLNLEFLNESADAAQFGIETHSRPIDLRQQVAIEPIPIDQLDKTIQSMPRTGVFIHCEHGQDRTGLLVAMWRVRRNGWTKDQAEKEMLDRGFHRNLFGLWNAWKQWTPQ